MNDAVIVGYGMVGKATAHAFGVKDYYSPSNHTIEKSELSRFKYIFLCLPTPTVDGIQDDSLLRDYIIDISNKNPETIFIVRSTVLPGFCRSFMPTVNIVHVPEFLTEKTWKRDVEWPSIVVIGGENRDILTEVAGFFKARYKGCKIILTDTITSELSKYALNTLYATKVVFANEIFDYAQKVGANYETVKEVLYASNWVGVNHLDVWHQGGKGAGGKCLEKDLEAFSKESASSLLIEANKINKQLIKSFPKENDNTKTS